MAHQWNEIAKCINYDFAKKENHSISMHVYVYKFILWYITYNKILAHTIIEAENSHN